MVQSTLPNETLVVGWQLTNPTSSVAPAAQSVAPNETRNAHMHPSQPNSDNIRPSAASTAISTPSSAKPRNPLRDEPPSRQTLIDNLQPLISHTAGTSSTSAKPRNELPRGEPIQQNPGNSIHPPALPVVGASSIAPSDTPRENILNQPSSGDSSRSPPNGTLYAKPRSVPPQDRPTNQQSSDNIKPFTADVVSPSSGDTMRPSISPAVKIRDERPRNVPDHQIPGDNIRPSASPKKPRNKPSGDKLPDQQRFDGDGQPSPLPAAGPLPPRKPREEPRRDEPVKRSSGNNSRLSAAPTADSSSPKHRNEPRKNDFNQESIDSGSKPIVSLEPHRNEPTQQTSGSDTRPSTSLLSATSTSSSWKEYCRRGSNQEILRNHSRHSVSPIAGTQSTKPKGALLQDSPSQRALGDDGRSSALAHTTHIWSSNRTVSGDKSRTSASLSTDNSSANPRNTSRDDANRRTSDNNGRISAPPTDASSANSGSALPGHDPNQKPSGDVYKWTCGVVGVTAMGVAAVAGFPITAGIAGIVGVTGFVSLAR